MAIHSLVKVGQFTTIKQIIESSPPHKSLAVMNERDCEGFTSVHIACVIGRLEVLVFLRERGASLTARDIKGRTPLAWAALKGHTEVVRYLLRQPEVNPALADFSNDTPLHVAAGQGRTEICGLLCESPLVDVNARNAVFAQTPLAAAAWAGWVGIVKLLREFGAEVNTRDRRGFTPLHFAAQMGHAYLVEYLVQEGASLTARTTAERLTPLDVAANDATRELMQRTRRVVPSLQRLCVRAIRSARVPQERQAQLSGPLQALLRKADVPA